MRGQRACRGRSLPRSGPCGARDRNGDKAISELRLCGRRKGPVDSPKSLRGQRCNRLGVAAPEGHADSYAAAVDVVLEVAGQ